jgi:cGMP-dependent protein kinase
MFYCSVSCDHYIFKEGSKALCFFIIEKGTMHIISDDKVKKQLRVGDGFGELALLYRAPRPTSVKATESCNLWGIDRDSFRKAV